MRILLVQPAPFEPGRLGLENAVWLSEPVALTQLAAMLPEHDVRVIDMRLEEDLALNRMLLEFRPNLVGITSMTTDCYQAKAVAETAKGTLGPECFTIIGGHHPTLAPEDFHEDCVDALCLGEGEDTFRELVRHLDAGGDPKQLEQIPGLHFERPDGQWMTTDRRAQTRDLDSLPTPARHLIKKYAGEYFYLVGSSMGSMATSRGCSFDCNFCAIWEFYERKTRFLSAQAICDQLEQMEEDIVFFLDDNFLTNRKRLEELCDELERRGIKKYYATQGRTDFIADNPELMRRLRDAGFIMILSGYESNEENGLEALLKRNTVEKNMKAAQILRDLGIVSTGIFMVRPDFTESDFDRLYQHINDLGVAFPIVTILTPLPGTQLYRQRYTELLTVDARFFDLLHAVLPTRLPRERFYEKFTQQRDATWRSVVRGLLPALRKRPKFFLKSATGVARWLSKQRRYRPIFRDPGSHLRDEVGKISIDVTAADAPTRVEPADLGAQIWNRARAGQSSPNLVKLRRRLSNDDASTTLSSRPA